MIKQIDFYLCFSLVCKCCPCLCHRLNHRNLHWSLCQHQRQRCVQVTIIPIIVIIATITTIITIAIAIAIKCYHDHHHLGHIIITISLFSMCILGERLLWQVDNCTKDPVKGEIMGMIMKMVKVMIMTKIMMMMLNPVKNKVIMMAA